ncbi:MAG: imidazole glycerol phosphate synthase subunit HisF, partial [Actinobacteria bacterium]|nr:imidazole glycerol phosphate synthase subunit HisF [Actinomycetota bacterium]
LELTRAVAASVSVPVIAHGGAGSPEHVCRVLMDGAADAVTLASVLHYDAIDKINALRTSDAEGNFEFLRSGLPTKRIQRCSIAGVKSALTTANISCRPDTNGR